MLRERGFQAQVVERWNPHARVRQDLFGIVDIVAVGQGCTIAVQTTSYSNVSSRVQKIRQAEVLPVLLDSGWVVWVHGWHKVGGRWKCREVRISAEPGLHSSADLGPP
jgi:hypothetical protein